MAADWRWACWAAFALTQLAAVAGKHQTGVLRLTPGGKDPWQYLGKFGYAIGNGTFDLKLRLRPPKGVQPKAAPHQVRVDVFLDEEWPRALALPPCQRGKEARLQFMLSTGGDAGDWGPWEHRSLYQVMRPHIWYWALTDCQELSKPDVSYEVDYDMRWRQFDGSELSFEHWLLPRINIMLLAFFTAFVGRFLYRCTELRRRTFSLHPVVQALRFAITLQWLAQALHLWHLRTYDGNGVGVPTADAVSGLLFMLSQVAIASLLLAISRGFSLMPAEACHWQFLQPLVAGVVCLHVLLVGLGRLQGETMDTHHEHDGALGLALLAVRLLLYGWFVHGIRSLRGRAGYRLQHFLAHFQWAASAYFLAFPVLWSVTQLFAPYLRHPILHTGLAAMQIAAALWLAELFQSRGEYFEVSEMSSSLLPGASPHTSPASRASRASDPASPGRYKAE